MRKEKYTYQEIADKFNISQSTVIHYVSDKHQKVLQKNRIKHNEDIKKRYNTDPDFRRKMIDATIKYITRRADNDPEFKKYINQLSGKSLRKRIKKRQKLHPNSSINCIKGAHETTTQKGRCKGNYGRCACKCHANT